MLRFVLIFSKTKFADDNHGRFDNATTPKESIMPEASRDFTVKGQRKDLNTIFLKLRISDSTGCLLVHHFFQIHLIFSFQENYLKSCLMDLIRSYSEYPLPI